MTPPNAPRKPRLDPLLSAALKRREQERRAGIRAPSERTLRRQRLALDLSFLSPKPK